MTDIPMDPKLVAVAAGWLRSRMHGWTTPVHVRSIRKPVVITAADLCLAVNCQCQRLKTKKELL